MNAVRFVLTACMYRGHGVIFLRVHAKISWDRIRPWRYTGEKGYICLYGCIAEHIHTCTERDTCSIVLITLYAAVSSRMAVEVYIHHSRFQHGSSTRLFCRHFDVTFVVFLSFLDSLCSFLVPFLSPFLSFSLQLLKGGANVRALVHRGRKSALHYACKAGHFEAALLLVQYGKSFFVLLSVCCLIDLFFLSGWLAGTPLCLFCLLGLLFSVVITLFLQSIFSSTKASLDHTC